MSGFFLAIGQTLWVRLGLYCGEAKNAPPRAAGFLFMLAAVNKPLNTGASVNLFNSAVVCLVVAITGCDYDQGQNPWVVTAAKFANEKKDAESGDAVAQYNLGRFYLTGTGVPKDEREAAKWFRMAASQGVARAQYKLGVMYLWAQGVPQDKAEGMKWYRLAADQGHAEAQAGLGYAYYYGDSGLPQDYAEAWKWFRMAAEQEDADAQVRDMLASMYYHGEGVPQDFVEAYAWFSVAARGWASAGVQREEVAGKLPPEQLSKAKKRATELLKKIDSGKQPSQGEAAAESGTSSGPTSLKPSS